MLRTSNIELNYQGTFIKVMVLKNNYDFKKTINYSFLK